MQSSRTRESRSALARSQGFLAVASDGPLGRIEMTLCPADRDEPDYLVVRTGRVLRARRPVLSASLVEEIDPQRRLVYLRGRADQLAELGEHLPLAI
jgi:hypothetical protein